MTHNSSLTAQQIRSATNAPPGSSQQAAVSLRYHRLMRFITAPLLLLPFLQATAQASPAGARPTPASAAMTNYRNDALHLTYSYPGNYADATAVIGPAMEASLGGDPASAAVAHCITVPFSRMDTGAGAGQIGVVLLAHADSACLKKKFNPKSLADFTQGEAQGLSAAGAKTTFGQPISFELAGRPAASLQGTFTLPAGQPMFAQVTCVLTQPDVVCWQFLANSAERLKTLTAFPVTFDGSTPTPLAPSTSATKP